MPLMRSGKLTAPSWCCAAPESAMSWVSVSFVPLRVVISASIRLKPGHVRPVTTATPLRPLDQRGSFEADGSPCVSALLHAHDIALVPDEVQSELAEKAGYFERFLKMRLKQRQQIETQPKVGNEGSNPFARSKFPQGRQADKKCRSGRFLLTWPSFPSLES